jgi:pSer/pThr/pTyr-binding forkhead associated (FHA) protein
MASYEAENRLVLAGSASESDRTRALTLPPCPICGTAGVPGEEFCVECGFLVGSQPGEPADSGRSAPRLVDSGGREFPLKAGENIVGREGADVLLPDGTVSRRHARIVVEPAAVYVEDLGSTNGTRVRGAVVPAGRQTSITDRTPVQFGAVKLTAIIPSDALDTVPLLAATVTPAPAPEPAALPAFAPAAATAIPPARVSRPGSAEYVLADVRTAFGRKSGNNIVIDDDPFVSGKHAEIVVENGRFLLVDAGSTNGTKLNGRSLMAAIPEPLSDGDDIMIGHTSFRFVGPRSDDSAG